MLRLVECPHVRAGYEPQQLDRVSIAIDNVTMLLRVQVCVNCAELVRIGSAINLVPNENAGPDGCPPVMSVWLSSKGQPPPEPRTTPGDPIIRTVRKIGDHRVTLYAEPRLQDREILRWSTEYAAGNVSAAAFRRIIKEIRAGIPASPGGNLSELPAADVSRGRELQGRPAEAPGKRSTKKRLNWGPPRVTVPDSPA